MNEVGTIDGRQPARDTGRTDPTRSRDPLSRRFRRIVEVILVTVTVASCGGKAPVVAAPPPPVELTVELVAAADVNPDPAGRPSPVVVRLFVLTDSLAFTAASYQALATSAEATLGASRLTEVRRILHPGERVVIPLTLAPGAKDIGVVVEFADLLNAQWRAHLRRDDDAELVKALTGRKLVLSVERNHVSLRANAAGSSREQ